MYAPITRRRPLYDPTGFDPLSRFDQPPGMDIQPQANPATQPLQFVSPDNEPFSQLSTLGMKRAMQILMKKFKTGGGEGLGNEVEL